MFWVNKKYDPWGSRGLTRPFIECMTSIATSQEIIVVNSGFYDSKYLKAMNAELGNAVMVTLNARRLSGLEG